MISMRNLISIFIKTEECNTTVAVVVADNAATTKEDNRAAKATEVAVEVAATEDTAKVTEIVATVVEDKVETLDQADKVSEKVKPHLCRKM